jgi:uncharacterized protein (UPF0147 family)
MNLSPSLPTDVWQVLYAVLNDEPVKFPVRRGAMQQFEAAMQKAQEPPAPPPDDA